MARQAYPDVPLFRYDYTDLTKAQIADKMRAPALGGPGSKDALEDLGSADLRLYWRGREPSSPGNSLPATASRSMGASRPAMAR